ncbi:MAG: ABC transporter permease [Alphaproteobacteria bacterium]|nr:ABC transporter permease [Alphaproteobacteria bacterium]MCB9931023.1 ABC transporter permease [Alphaproteobacteria bacterium]
MTAISESAVATLPPRPSLGKRLRRLARKHPTAVVGFVILVVMTALAILAPWITPDPLRINPIVRLKPPGFEGPLGYAGPFGTDFLGRDLFARVIHGGQISLVVGLSVATVATVVGLAIGLVAGYIRWLDALVMRVMDGLMAIPGILVAIALVALAGASITNVIIAITIPEVPRVVRLVRSVVLTIREMPYIEAAVVSGVSLPRIMARHLLPNAVAPLIVQATYVFASAVVFEAILSFLGAGTPPEIPSWGNIMAEGRTYFQIAPWIIFFPGAFLAVTVLAVNILGDGLRDSLDPRIAKRMR